MRVGAHKDRWRFRARNFRAEIARSKLRVANARRSKQDNPLGKKLYVGNLSFSNTEADLKELFGRHGQVESVNVIMDRETGRPRGFAFVEMAEGSAAQDAIRALDGTDFGGRTIKVNEAQDRQRSGGRY